MVTEQTPSGDSANQLPKDEDNIEDITSTEPQQGAGEQTETGAADQTQGQSPEQRTFSAEEFSKYQSKTDKQISDLTSQLQEERATSKGTRTRSERAIRDGVQPARSRSTASGKKSQGARAVSRKKER